MFPGDNNTSERRSGKIEEDMRRDYSHALAETRTKVAAASSFCARSKLFCRYVTADKYVTRRSEIT